MAKRWMCGLLTAGWLGVCSSAMAQALPAFAPKNAPPAAPAPAAAAPPAAVLPGAPAPGCEPQPAPFTQPLLCPPEPCPTGPCLQFRAEYLVWALPRQELGGLVSTGSASDPIPGAIGQPNTRLLLGGRFGDDTPHSGLRLYASLGEDSNPYWSISANVFFLEQRGSQAVLSGDGSVGSGVLARPFQNVNVGVEDADPISFPGVLSGTFILQTERQMYGAEANLRWHYWESGGSRINFLIGPRFLFIEESLQMLVTTQELPAQGAPPSTFHFSERYATDNDFYGAQIGAEWQYRLGPVYVAATAKAALGQMYQNLHTRAQTQVVDGITGVVLTNNDRALFLSPNNVGSFSRKHFAVVPEVNARVGYDFTNNLGISVGYTYLWVSDVIRPANQVDRNVNVQPITTGADGTGLLPPARATPAFHSTSFWAQGLDAAFIVRF